MPERVDFWGIPSGLVDPAILVYVVMGLASAVLIGRLYRRASLWWRLGKPHRAWDRPIARLARLVRFGVLQTRVLRQRYPGLMHACLAGGFVVFFMGTALATIDSHFFKFLRGSTYQLYKLTLDAFTVAFLVGAAMAAYRRFVQRPRRLTADPRFARSLALIVVIVIGGLLVESLRLAVEPPGQWWSPVGSLVASLWRATGTTSETLRDWHTAMWSIHLLTVAALFVTLPASSLLHIVTSPLNVFFSRVDQPQGRLDSPATTAGGEPVYVKTVADLTWKQLLDSDACTECGRCQDVCPAFAAGTPLSPKQLVVDIRQSMLAADRQPEGEAMPLVGAAIGAAALWSCTTCGACVTECPVLIEHVGTIVDMRRHLVMDGQMDAELQDALSNYGRYGNSFGQSERSRAKWTQGIDPAIKDARKEPVDYLWFVGDYAAYSPTLTDVTRQTAAVFRRAGVDFGILFESERNSGNDVRRIGEEGLFEMLVEKNTAAMEKATYRRIVTTDPHSYNALLNEYPPETAHDGSIVHYTELLDSAIAAGELVLTKRLGYRVTYHDPCYLARYNGVTAAPRRIIAATGCDLAEMPRHGKATFCCGAGGGRIWMNESLLKERPSEARIREALTVDGVQVFVVACPKDVTMFRDAVKTVGAEGRIVVKDLIELVYEALD